MARQVRKNIEYFSFDVDFFDDPKMLFVSSRFDEKGEIITIKLLCWIYKNEGYYTKWNDEISMLFTKRAFANIKYTLVNDVVKELLKREFFDSVLYEKYGILTSSGIQKRWASVVDNGVINEQYNLINYKNTRVRMYNTNVKKWYRLIKKVFEIDNYTCQYCGQVGGKLEADHIIPFSKGGKDTIENLTTACRKCNRQKKDKSVDEFMKWKNTNNGKR